MMFFNGRHTVPKNSRLGIIIHEGFTSGSNFSSFYFFWIMDISTFFWGGSEWSVIGNSVFMVPNFVYIDSISIGSSTLVVMKWTKRLVNRYCWKMWTKSVV